MNILGLINRKCEVNLGIENDQLHEQLQQAVKENRTLRCAPGEQSSKSVTYLRERTWTEFFDETWDRIFGDGTIAATAEKKAWDAVHQALNGKIISMQVRQAASNVAKNAVALPESDRLLGHNKLVDEHLTFRKALKDARSTAQQVYSHIFGVKPAVDSIAIISERISVRLCDRQSFEQACVLTGGTNALAELVGRKKEDGGYDFSEEKGATACLQVLYASELKTALDSAKVDARFISIPYRYKPEEAQRYGWAAQDWKEMHVTALRQAIEELDPEKTRKAIVVVVANAKTFTDLQTDLNESEEARVMPLYKRAREVFLDPHHFQSA